AVQVAMELGVQPTALMPNNSVQGWLARVRAAMREAWDRLTNKPELFDSQDLVDLAFAVAQRENPAYASEFDGPSTPATPRPGITAQQAQDIVDKALDGLGMRGAVTPMIVQNPTAAGLVAPESMPSGGVSEGRLYLFLEGIRDEVEGFRVVFHELFHLGLSQSVTLQEYRQTMLHLLTDPLVRKYAARWKNSEDGQHRRGSMPVNNWHALAVEEALADMAEVNKDPGPILAIAKGIPATRSAMTASPPNLPHPLSGTARNPPHQNQSLLSMHESETRMDYYDPGGPLIWESEEQSALVEAALALTERPQVPQGTVVVASPFVNPPNPTMDTLRAPHNRPEQLPAERAV
ncbi:hypothetical protein PMI14_05327, partial [Acidovorax sp. CF316]|uniref:hypothetical protein n=1 Tax=Acidovorax sp. CF316 TaxID=1144317 RepID=UPI00026BD034